VERIAPQAADAGVPVPVLQWMAPDEAARRRTRRRKQMSQMQPEHEKICQYIRDLQEQVSLLRRELYQHYSNHQVAHNRTLDQERLWMY
jgi:hypothetical protein